jgi:lipopolysaccharide heptosyltransferase II
MLYPESILQDSLRIAVVRTDRLGDMVLTIPLCRALKEQYPNAEISIICSSYTKPLVENCPAIDKVFAMDNPQKQIRGVFRDYKFNAVFFPRPKLNEAWAAFLEGVPLRVGTAYRGYSFLFNHRVYDHRKNAEHHEAEYNCRLAESAGKFKAEVKLVKPALESKALAEIDKYLKEVLTAERFMIIHPGSGGSARDWPIENFAKSAKLIQEKHNIDIILSGSAQEQEQCEAIKSVCSKAIISAGKFDLVHLIALISRSSLLAANSTGVLHIAAALEVPVVGFYPNTPHLSARRWGPYTDKRIILSPPADSPDIDDMSKIGTDVFVEAVGEMIK